MSFLNANVNAFEKFITFIGKSSEKPNAYAPFHIISILIILAFSLAVVLNRRKITEKFLAYTMLAFGTVLVVFEIYKQFVMSYNPATDTWSYQWYIFPFQFCSTPIYLTFIAFVFYKLKKKRLFDTVTAFLGTYSLIGAFVVLFVGTDTVFSTIIGVSIQTMIHHGIMFVLAVMILVSGCVSFNLKTGFDIYKLFAVLVVIALVLNSIHGDGTKFDMFYLAPESQFVYPMFNKLFGGNLPHFVYVIGYIFLFTLGAFIIIAIGHLLTEKKHKCKTDED